MAALTAAIPALALWEAWRAHQNGPTQQATAKQWLQGHGSQAQIRAALRSVLAKVWAQSFAAGVGLAAELLQLAINLFAEDHLKALESAWLDEITGTYMDWLANELADGDLSGFNAVLADKAHAELIALTEINRGYNAGAYASYKAKQVKRVRWVTTSVDPCPECLGNEAAGPWPLGKPFPSGVIMPPDHPHCQCHLEPA